MNKNRQKDFEGALVNKTITRVNASCVNNIKLTFSDGTQAAMYSEVYNGLPHIEIHKEKNLDDQTEDLSKQQLDRLVNWLYKNHKISAADIQDWRKENKLPTIGEF